MDSGPSGLRLQWTVRESGGEPDLSNDEEWLMFLQSGAAEVGGIQQCAVICLLLKRTVTAMTLVRSDGVEALLPPPPLLRSLFSLSHNLPVRDAGTAP